MASEAYHDWSDEAAGARLRVNFTLRLLLSQNFCHQPLMRFISFASNIGPAAAGPAGPAPAPLKREGIGPCSPTPVSPTLDQKVAFRLLIEKKLYLGIKVMSNHILKHRLVFENVFVR